MRLRRHLKALTLIAMLGVGAGCSYPLAKINKGSPDAAEYTGSVKPVKASARSTAATPDGDLALAKAAARELLARDEDDGSQGWENPQTGARGTVTTMAAAYEQDGFTCRNFIASYVRDGSESWLQGEACRVHQGRWDVKSLKPWKRT